MSAHKKKKLKEVLVIVGGFLLVNFVFIFFGSRHSKSFLEEYPNQPFKAVLISLAITTLAFTFIWFKTNDK